MSTPCILVTDGESRAALAAVRSLGASGYSVHVASSDPGSIAGGSRFSVDEHLVPDASDRPDEWAESILRIAARIGADLLLPVTEVSIGSAFATGLTDRLSTVCPARDAYEQAVDKHGLVERALRIGLDVPAGCLIEHPSELTELPTGFEYPVVLKPRRSRFVRDGRWVTGDVRIVAGPEELRAAAAEPGMAEGALLQTFVPGHGEAIFVAAQAGEVVASFAHRRLREKPPRGGVSVLRESIAPDPKLLRGSSRLVAELGFTGVAMVEFRRSTDGRAFLMEINPRLWGSVQLAIDAGVDFPAIQVALHRGERVPPVEPRLAVRCRWMLGDFDHMLICLRRRRERAATGRSRTRVVTDFVRGFFDASRHEVWRRDDPRPFLRELRSWPWS